MKHTHWRFRDFTRYREFIADSKEDAVARLREIETNVSEYSLVSVKDCCGIYCHEITSN